MVPRPISVLMLVMLVVSISGTIGLSETDPGSIGIDFLRQFGGALIGGGLAFWGSVIAMRQQVAEMGRRLASLEARQDRHEIEARASLGKIHDRISAHIDNHAEGRFGGIGGRPNGDD